ncbi:MAG: glycoside hydrolase family 3 N-terminal domain-containing protein [Candidatus Nealsonbacteria bacterium]
MEENQSNFDEKLEFLKREEIRTMAKDVAKLREEEAQKERERIAAMTPKAAPPVNLPVTPAKEEKPTVPVQPTVSAQPVIRAQPVNIIPPPLKKSFLAKKILIRIGVVLTLVSLIGFFCWLSINKGFFVINQQNKEKEIPIEESPIIQEQINVPPSLIMVKEDKSFEVSNMETVPDIFKQLLNEDLEQGTFTRILIKDLAKNQIASLRDIAFAFQLAIPEEIYPKLEDNITLSIFSQDRGNRLAFVGKIRENDNLLSILKNWEKDMEQKGVFLSGQQIKTSAVSFKTALHNEVGFRYLTISSNDYGICYAWFGDYFVFTTSFESMEKVIDSLTLKEPEVQIGQMFIVGFEGKSVTPELQGFFKKYRPGGVLLLSKNIESAEQLKKLTSDLQNLSLKETGLPLFISVDQEGGIISRIGFLQEKTPQSDIIGETQAYQIGLKRAEELKYLGINLNLAPVLDSTQEGDFLFDRSFQKNAEETGILAKLLVFGQKTGKILSAIKHFPGYGGIKFNPETELASLEKVPEYSQFEKTMEAIPEFVMTSNMTYQEIDPDLPFNFSAKAIQFLKDKLGSQILIISDDLDQNSLLNNFSLKEIVVKPAEAGIDILIFSGYRLSPAKALDEFFAAYKNNEISKEKVDSAVSRIIQLKQTNKDLLQ